MKLIELEPRWFTFNNIDRLGLTFLCPHCKQQRLGVAFHHLGHENMEDTIIKARQPNGFIWNLTGDLFENISITPSIDASHANHWHGYITNGQII